MELGRAPSYKRVTPLVLPSALCPCGSASLLPQGRLQQLDLCIQRDHPLNRPATYGTELVVAREHDAVLLGPVVTFRFVERSFERANLAGIFVAIEQVI